MDALTELQAIAAEALAALDAGRQIQPFSSRTSSFNLDDAYRVTAAVRKMREARGELPVGRKIGFTNRKAWVDYNVSEPMWGYVYDRTVHYLAELGDTFSLQQLAEPRIEPEIVFRLTIAPAPGMEERTLLESVDWVAHGFEVVQSILPGWHFSVPDTVAAFGVQCPAYRASSPGRNACRGLEPNSFDFRNRSETRRHSGRPRVWYERLGRTYMCTAAFDRSSRARSG